MKSFIDCFKCKYFYVTWDKTSSKGCRYFGFKTNQIPSVAVKKISNKECAAYVAKDNIKKHISRI